MPEALCDYDLSPLILGENWTKTRQAKGELICRRCASRISQGTMSRLDRVKHDSTSIKRGRIAGAATQVPVAQDMSKHNDEMLLPHRARQLFDARERVRRQMTPEVMASLSNPYAAVTSTITLK
jgi:hypothetical protein